MRFIPVALVCALAAPALVLGACGDDVQNTPKSGSDGTGGSIAGVSSSSSESSSSAGGMDAGPDVDNGMPSDVYPAPHPDAPRVVNLGGPVLKNPKIYPVFFANDDPAITAGLSDFVNVIGTTAYWTANVGEYGIGPATGQPPIQLTETATGTIDDAALQAWLAAKLNANDPAFPVPDADTLIALFYPAGFTITEGGGASCQDFGGYHFSTQLDAAHGNIDVAYAVMPRCADFAGLTGIDAVTAAGSHEFIEAATDPLPEAAPAWGQLDNDHFYWMFLLGAETGDLCAQSAGAFTKFPEIDYVVQRAWSNKSAKASHDPCVPNLMGQAYFNSVPIFEDTLDLGGGLTMKGAKIGLGETKTVDLALFSDAKTDGPWTVEALDFGQLQGQQPELEFSFDRTTGVNGEKLHLSITVLQKSQFDAELFLLVSSLGNQQNFWVGIVGN